MRVSVSTDVHVTGVPLYTCDVCGRAQIGRVFGARMGRDSAAPWSGSELECDGASSPEGWLTFTWPIDGDASALGWREIAACADCRASVVASVTQFLAVLLKEGT